MESSVTELSPSMVGLVELLAVPEAFVVDDLHQLIFGSLPRPPNSLLEAGIFSQCNDMMEINRILQIFTGLNYLFTYLHIFWNHSLLCSSCRECDGDLYWLICNETHTASRRVRRQGELWSHKTTHLVLLHEDSDLASRCSVVISDFLELLMRLATVSEHNGDRKETPMMHCVALFVSRICEQNSDSSMTVTVPSSLHAVVMEILQVLLLEFHLMSYLDNVWGVDSQELLFFLCDFPLPLYFLLVTVGCGRAKATHKLKMQFKSQGCLQRQRRDCFYRKRGDSLTVLVNDHDGFAGQKIITHSKRLQTIFEFPYGSSPRPPDGLCVFTSSHFYEWIGHSHHVISPAHIVLHTPIEKYREISSRTSLFFSLSIQDESILLPS